MENDLPLQLLSSCIRSLGHEIRNPLSVISNELFVLQSKGVDVELLAEKVRIIGETFSTLQSFSESESQRERVRLRDFLAALLTDISVKGEGDPFWLMRRERCARVFSALFELLVAHTPLTKVQIEMLPGGFLITLPSPPPQAHEGRSLAHHLFGAQHVDDSRLPLSEAVLCAEEISFRLSGQSSPLFPGIIFEQGVIS
ncbi:hypothetical protein MRY87_06455 [bacterium]|nr:hypothetical protein [bacterium]